VQEVIPLEQNSGELKLTVAYYYLPSGRLVHKKKDATDWGVKPQIPVEMTDEQEKKAFEERLQQELFKRPMPKATTAAVTRPTTAAVTDVQLQRAVDVMMAWLIFAGGSQDTGNVLAALPQPPATQAASAPATQEASTPRPRGKMTTPATSAPSE
jgi:hypothetical protein